MAALIERRWPEAPGFVAEVRDVLTILEPLLRSAPRLVADGVLERFCEPERVVMFQVPWRASAPAS